MLAKHYYMKMRTVISLSFVSLFAVVLIQLGGMLYAYHAQKKEAEQSLNSNFWMAFTETVDNLVNNLPYPDGTMAILTYHPNPKYKRLSRNEGNERTSQQAAQVLQQVYGVKEIPLATLDSVLHNKLRKRDIDGDLTVERINAGTGEVLESTNPAISLQSFSTVVSDAAFTYKARGEAVRAIVSFPLKEFGKRILLLSLITLVLLGVSAGALVSQLKSLFRQRRSLQEQQQSFYQLAEEMSQPVSGIKQKIAQAAWGEIEVQSHVLFEKTDGTLAQARTAEQERKVGRRVSLKTVSIASLAGVFLLMAVWSGYLYHITSQRIKWQAEEQLEEAFYQETDHHRYPLFSDANPGYKKANMASDSVTPYVDRFMKELYKLYLTKGYRYRINALFVVHVYNKFDESFRMKMAYDAQDTINLNSRMPIPFSLHYADSTFRSNLSETGFPHRADIHWFRHPSEELMLYTGSPSVGFWDIPTKLIPLDRDSTTCIRAVVRSPQISVAAATWRMQVPMLATFLFVCICVVFQIRMLRAQRRLEQFQKDFTYSMIHDMKSPLQSVMMGAHVLASGKLADKPEKVSHYKQAMEDECEHLLTLSNRVVMLTQIDRGELELHKEEVPLRPLLQDISEKFQLKAVKKVLFEIDCEEECTVYADAFCLREVLSNLVDNAIKYSKEEVTITLSGERTKDGSIIKVRDNGIGIPLREQHKIFGKFERVASGSQKTGASGFGLGLNYVLQVVDAHDGVVKVESVEGSYSEFTMHF